MAALNMSPSSKYKLKMMLLRYHTYTILTGQVHVCIRLEESSMLQHFVSEFHVESRVGKGTHEFGCSLLSKLYAMNPSGEVI